MERVLTAKEKEAQAVRSDFEQQGFDPEIVDEIATWGRLSRLSNGFSLGISKWEESSSTHQVYSHVEYHYGVDGRLTLHHSSYERTRGMIHLFGFKKLSIENKEAHKFLKQGSLRFEADFGTIGRHIVWFNGNGEFEIESSVGKVRG